MSNCPNVLTYGTCSDTSCPHNHNITTCESCALVFPTNDQYQAHLLQNQHRARANGASIAQSCPICKMNINGGQKGWNIHVKGRKHCSTASRLRVSPSVNPEAARQTKKEMSCELCQVVVEIRSWDSHVKNKRHLARITFNKYTSAVVEAESDKHDISVEGNLDFDFVAPEVATNGVRKEITVRTTHPFAKCVLLDVKLASSQGSRAIHVGFEVPRPSVPRNLTQTRPLTFAAVFKQSHIGRYEDRLELVFEDSQLRKRFVISRTLKAIVGDRETHEALKPKSPYIPRTRSTRKDIGEVVEGIKPPSLTAIPYVGLLPRAPIPAHLQAILAGSESDGRTAKHIRKVFLPAKFNNVSYGRQFKQLLWIEEFKMEQDLERYDIPNATLSRYNNYYYLTVPGLAEKRPSVLVGDRILVQESGAADSRWYEGHVHVVRQAEVGLRFHGSFDRYSENKRFHIRFKLSRIPVRRQHQALDSVFTEDRVLFPDVAHLTPGPAKTREDISLRLYNKLISGNEPQLQAVVSIATLPPGSPPFVVFGPPGTGKTITIVEAIRQVLVQDPLARVLACAPSNSAADLIALRLKVGLTKDEMFRFYAPSRFKNQVPDELLPYTHTAPDGHFALPPNPGLRMKRYRVIVTTCVSASMANGIGMPRGHFSHIFIDEAGQATEPEATVSFKTMSDSKTNIILSGDPKQLGPIIRSGIARELGLETSYLERLMDRDVYDLRNGYGKTVVKLTKNFRSHNAILKFPNERFYDNDLQECAMPSVINAYLKSSYLPSPKFPVVFHAVSGKDDREASSPSFFNIDEVLQVKSYVQRLRQDKQFRTTDADIGIIAPYHAQCLKLRTALRGVADGVKVGSVEEFQGQERKVIIISTVRSSKEFVEYDLKHTLGFVASPRRFNVAITRAQALLIIVGDPQVLSLDPLWRSFLNYIYLSGGWNGPDITWDPKAPVDEAGGYDKAIREAAKLDMNEFTRRMETMTMAEVEDDVDANVDRPWRDVE